MKAKLLKKFRKRFQIIQHGEGSFALLDHKSERVIYKILGNPIRSRSEAIMVGVDKLIGIVYHGELITTRRKRIYRSHLTKK